MHYRAAEHALESCVAGGVGRAGEVGAPSALSPCYLLPLLLWFLVFLGILLPLLLLGSNVLGAVLSLGLFFVFKLNFLVGRLLAGLGIVVERNAYRTTVVAIILPNDLLGVQLPQARIVVAACRHEVGAIGAEGTVPHPALVAR